VITRPVITKTQLQNGKLLAEGKIEAYVLYLTDSNESPVYSLKKEIPFSYLLDCESTDDDLIPEIKAEVKHTSYNLNMAGEIELRCILSLNANIIRKRKIEIINDVVTEERENDDKKGIVIYFVQRGDNLWEVAKRYAVPRNEILKFNNMDETDKLEVGSRLFIPSI
jgi:nucleoid-associated protein YgaU